MPDQGCFAYGADGERALAGVPQAIQAYGGERWLPGGPVAFELAETCQVYAILPLAQTN